MNILNVIDESFSQISSLFQQIEKNVEKKLKKIITESKYRFDQIFYELQDCINDLNE